MESYTDIVEVGDVVSVRHYSALSTFKSIVAGIHEKILALKLEKGACLINFLDGDPVVLGFEIDDKIYIFGCNVLNVDPRTSVLEVQVDEIETEEQRRQFERFPVSLYADIKIPNMKKKYLATIKNLSFSGMHVYSKADILEGDIIDLDIYMEKVMLFLSAKIIRKYVSQYYVEYGLEIIYNDNNALGYMRDYIKKLKIAQEAAITKMKFLSENQD